MKKTKITLIVATLVPILALFSLMLYKQNIISRGQTFTLPIVGFDPRDLLSGHYLRYEIDYQAEQPCKSEAMNLSKAYLCLEPRAFYTDKSSLAHCPTYLTGTCKNDQFISGIERFYIPQSHAKILDRYVRDARGELLISVNSDGKGVIKDLLIDGVTWKELELPEKQ